MNKKAFIKALSDSDLADFASEIRKERERRKKINHANNTWTCNEGLSQVLEASINYVSNNSR